MYKKLSDLNDREKKLIALAASMFILMCIYLVFTKIPNLFGPSIRSIINKNTTELNLLLPKIAKIKQLKKNNYNYQKIPDNNLYNLINTNKPDLVVLENDQPEIIKQNTDQQVLLKYKAVSFDSFIQWLQEFHNKYGVIIDQAEIKPIENKSGYISIELLIKSDR